jgi:hypothetical protein
LLSDATRLASDQPLGGPADVVAIGSVLGSKLSEINRTGTHPGLSPVDGDSVNLAGQPGYWNATVNASTSIAIPFGNPVGQNSRLYSSVG